MPTPERLKELLAQIEAIAEELRQEIAASGPPAPIEPKVSFDGLDVGIELAGEQKGPRFFVDILLTDVAEEDKITSVAMEIESTDPDLVYVGYDREDTIMNAAGWIHRTNPANGRLGGFSSSMSAITASGLLARLEFRIERPVDGEVRIKNLALHCTGRGKVRTNTDLVIPVQI